MIFRNFDFFASDNENLCWSYDLRNFWSFCVCQWAPCTSICYHWTDLGLAFDCLPAQSYSVKTNTNTSAPILSGKPSMPGESITVKVTAICWRTEKIQNLNFLWRDLRSIVQSWNRRLCFAIIFISHSPLFIKQFSCSDTDSSLFRHHPLTLGLRSFFHWVCRIVDLGIGERFTLKMVVNAGSWQLEDQNRVYGLKWAPCPCHQIHWNGWIVWFIKIILKLPLVSLFAVHNF